jgi:hypothetical protein
MEIEPTDEARLRKAFADAVRALQKEAADPALYRVAVIAAAGALVCRIAKDSGLSKETMLKVMDRIWENDFKEPVRTGN